LLRGCVLQFISSLISQIWVALVFSGGVSQVPLFKFDGPVDVAAVNLWFFLCLPWASMPTKVKTRLFGSVIRVLRLGVVGAATSGCARQLPILQKEPSPARGSRTFLFCCWVRTPISWCPHHVLLRGSVLCFA
jgi:hypothetical protein